MCHTSTLTFLPCAYRKQCQIRPTADIFTSNSFKKCALIPVNNDLFCSVLARPSNFGSSVLRVLGLCFFCESRKNSFTDVCCVFKVW